MCAPLLFNMCRRRAEQRSQTRGENEPPPKVFYRTPTPPLQNRLFSMLPVAPHRQTSVLPDCDCKSILLVFFFFFLTSDFLFTLFDPHSAWEYRDGRMARIKDYLGCASF